MSRIVAALALLLVLGTTACHTVSGAGEDVRRTGQWIERRAN